MKKIRKILFVSFVLLCSSSVLFAAKKDKSKDKKSNVSETKKSVQATKIDTVEILTPKYDSTQETVNWIPNFVQSMISSNLQIYSGMNVIDKKKNDEILEEMAKQDGAYSEADEIEFGNFAQANLSVQGNILKTDKSYAMTFSITDKQSGSQRASARVMNCSESSIRSGLAIGKLSYDLMSKYGCELDEDAKRELTEEPIKPWMNEYKSDCVVYDVLQRDDKVFVIGTEITTDKKRNEYKAGYLQCLDMKGNQLWKKFVGDEKLDTTLYAMEFDKVGNIIIVGNIIGDNWYGIYSVYNTDGNCLKYEKTSGANYISDICISDKECLLTGGDLEGNEIAYVLKKDYSIVEGNSILSEYTRKNSKAKKLIDSKIQEISKVRKDSAGRIYIAGETSFLEKPVAAIVCADSKGKIELVYQAKQPNSYVAEMRIDEEHGRLLISGSQNGKDSFGNGGTPFIRCLDLNDFSTIWEHEAVGSKYEVYSRLTPCETVGFIQVLVNADDDGYLTTPCAVVRTNSEGKIVF